MLYANTYRCSGEGDIFTRVYLEFLGRRGSPGANCNDPIKDGENLQPGFRLPEV